MKIRKGTQEILGRAAAQHDLKSVFDQSQKNALASIVAPGK